MCSGAQTKGFHGTPTRASSAPSSLLPPRVVFQFTSSVVSRFYRPGGRIGKPSFRSDLPRPSSMPHLAPLFSEIHRSHSCWTHSVLEGSFPLPIFELTRRSLVVLIIEPCSRKHAGHDVILLGDMSDLVIQGLNVRNPPEHCQVRSHASGNHAEKWQVVYPDYNFRPYQVVFVGLNRRNDTQGSRLTWAYPCCCSLNTFTSN